VGNGRKVKFKFRGKGGKLDRPTLELDHLEISDLQLVKEHDDKHDKSSLAAQGM
jgi:hypothetical protein